MTFKGFLSFYLGASPKFHVEFLHERQLCKRNVHTKVFRMEHSLLLIQFYLVNTCHEKGPRWEDNRKRTKALNKIKEAKVFHMCNCDSPWSARPVFKDGWGEASLELILFPVGGRHLFEKNAAIFVALLPSFSANWKGNIVQSQKNKSFRWNHDKMHQCTSVYLGATSQACPKFLS